MRHLERVVDEDDHILVVVEDEMLDALALEGEDLVAPYSLVVAIQTAVDMMVGEV